MRIVLHVVVICYLYFAPIAIGRDYTFGAFPKAIVTFPIVLIAFPKALVMFTKAPATFPKAPLPSPIIHLSRCNGAYRWERLHRGVGAAVGMQQLVGIGQKYGR